jgi:Flp pilus assembly pilin Flp
MLTVAAGYNGLVQPPGARMILARPSRDEQSATAAEAAGIVAIVMVALGPFIGFALGRSASKRRSRDTANRGTSSS